MIRSFTLALFVIHFGAPAAISNAEQHLLASSPSAGVHSRAADTDTAVTVATTGEADLTQDARLFIRMTTDDELDLLSSAATAPAGSAGDGTAEAVGKAGGPPAVTSFSSDRMKVYIGEIFCAAALAVTFYQYRSRESDSIYHAYATYACCIYLIGSIAIDVTIKDSPMRVSPALLVFLVEFGKLIFSSGLWIATRDKTAPIMTSTALPPFLLSAAFFVAYNIMVFYSIKNNDIGAFAIFRETAIIWTALTWSFVFRVSLGSVRWLTIFGVFGGLVINQLSLVHFSQPFNSAILVVIAGTLCNACGSVANEFAVKSCIQVDINLQNTVLYALSSVGSLLALWVQQPQAFTRLDRTFAGFDKHTAAIVFLQLFQGLIVSRILKYANSMVKNAVSTLRGPLLLFASMHLGFPVRFDVYVAVSALVTGVFACWFLMLGRPQKTDGAA